jgi:hypothetical protein
LIDPSMTMWLTNASLSGWASAEKPVAASPENKMSLSAQRFDDFFNIFPNKLFVSRVTQ